MRALRDLIGHALGLVRHFIEPVSHEPLDRIDRILWIGYRLALGHLPDQPFARFRDGNDRRSRSPALLIRNHGRFSALHHSNHRIGRPQIDSNDLAHDLFPLPKISSGSSGMSATDAAILHIECIIVK